MESNKKEKVKVKGEVEVNPRELTAILKKVHALCETYYNFLEETINKNDKK